jgi:hypothetical protein
MEVIMLLPGVMATMYRAQFRHIINRYLAGDQTLHKEINTNAASDAPINNLARQSMDLHQPPSIMDIDERTSGLKRLREEGGDGVNQAMMMQDMPMLMEQMVGYMTQTCTKASQDIAKIQAEARNQQFVDNQKLGEQEFMEMQQLSAKNDLEINHLTKMSKIRVDEATRLADEEKHLIAARQVPR